MTCFVMGTAVLSGFLWGLRPHTPLGGSVAPQTPYNEMPSSASERSLALEKMRH